MTTTTFRTHGEVNAERDELERQGVLAAGGPVAAAVSIQANGAAALRAEYVTLVRALAGKPDWQHTPDEVRRLSELLTALKIPGGDAQRDLAAVRRRAELEAQIREA